LPSRRLTLDGQAHRHSWWGPALVVLGLLGPQAVAAREYVVFIAGIAQPLGQTSHFADGGESFGAAWRHYNRGRTAFELQINYSQNPLSGEIQETVDGYEGLVRQKNLLAQQQGGPGQGFLIAEYGTLEMISLGFNFLFRVDERWRVAPVLSVGAGIYNWRLPFRLKFFDVPSFGEQHAYDAIDPSHSYQFVFDDRYPEQVIDYTKQETSGGLNLGIGFDARLSRHWNVGVDARSHLIFSSGQGDPELKADDQNYLDTMAMLQLQGGLVYRF